MVSGVITGGRRRRRRPIYAWRWDRIAIAVVLTIGAVSGVIAIVVIAIQIASS
jgi:hypothetical protein